MKIHLSNYDYLRNFDVFLRGFDPRNPQRLDITTNDKWISTHPAILTQVAALGIQVDPKNIKFDDITARSGHYLDIMGLFKILGKESPFKVESHEPAGRYIPLTQIKTPKQQTHFIHDMIPLLHLDPEKADAIKYTVGELVRNVLEHAIAPNGAHLCRLVGALNDLCSEEHSGKSALVLIHSLKLLMRKRRSNFSGVTYLPN